MSALLVKRHVADGLELARRWRLPRAVADIIAQHHGTRLVGYLAKQQKLAEAGERPPADADEALFRYPGAQAASREAALVMLADACEASARGPWPTPTASRAAGAWWRSAVGEIVAEGQLDECELTTRRPGRRRRRHDERPGGGLPGPCSPAAPTDPPSHRRPSSSSAREPTIELPKRATRPGGPWRATCAAVPARCCSAVGRPDAALSILVITDG